ncbi:sporulation membrane protein YtaF [Terribacillus halophilus]|uniref:sporulation membrane protein YtaF n=1 Tax=Terribacillus halophilus TaxID=361279 RepID=UPI0039827DDD
MLYFTGLFLLVVAVSLDGFGVGVTYGMRQIRISFLALMIIMLCTGVMVLTSMTIGSLLSDFIPSSAAGIFGSLILISIGLFSLYNGLVSKKSTFAEEDSITENKFEEKEWKLEIKGLGLLITVLKKPHMADVDKSGTISAKESLLLGFALSLDAFGAGIGANMVSAYPPILTAASAAAMSGLFIFFGIKSGYILAKIKWMQRLVLLPPCLLIALGLLKML